MKKGLLKRVFNTIVVGVMTFAMLFYGGLVPTVSAVGTIGINYGGQLLDRGTGAGLYSFNAYSMSGFSSVVLYYGTGTTTGQIFSQNNVSLTGTIIPGTPDIYSGGNASLGGLSYSTTYRYFIRITDDGSQIFDSSLNSFTTTGDIVAGIFDTIDATLTTNGILNNLNIVDSTNINNVSGLYFEQSGLGKITFNTGLDLEDSATQTFLQNLNSYLDMDDGFIGFDANASAEFQSKNAVLEMYFPASMYSYLSTVGSSDVVVKSGSVLDPTALGSVTPPVSCTTNCVLTLDANHFTTFDLKPGLTNVKIKSSNSNTSFAKSGDVVTLYFSGSEALTGVSVTMSGISNVIVVGGGDNWRAYGTVPTNGYVGNVGFTINYQDYTNNTGDTVTTTNDSSYVSYTDSTAPIVTLNGSSPINVEVNGVYTEQGARWTDNADGSGSISTPTSGSVNTGVIGTYTLYYIKVDSSGNTGQITRTVNVVADATSPVVSLNGSNYIYVILGSQYTEEGARWTDSIDGSGVISTPTSGSVNTGVLGTYVLYYIKVDAAGNTGQAIRNVVVKTVNGGGSSGGSTTSGSINTGTITTGDYGIVTNDGGQGDITNSTYSDELNEAYLFAFRAGITTKPTIQEADMNGNLIRSHLAKMLVNYARYILGKNPDTTIKCEFTDMSEQSPEMQGYAVLACQLGIMGLNSDGTPSNEFSPDLEVNRATFATTLSRLLRGNKYNTQGDDRYTAHLEALNLVEVMKNISDPMMKELRGYVMLMLMRAKTM